MSEFASVLRSWRDRVRPEEVGLPAGPGRRTPGLRREEERDHLCRVAGSTPPSRRLVPRHVTPGVQRIVDRLGDVPLAVFTSAHDIVLWNDLWAAVSGDPSRWTGLERNLVWQHFVLGHDGVDWDDTHQEEFSSDLVADLRAALGRYPADRDLADLVARLRRASPDFERRWETGRIAEHRASRKTVHTTVGPIEIDCDVLRVPGDLRVVVYTVVPGSEDAAKLDLLRVTGLQELTPR